MQAQRSSAIADRRAGRQNQKFRLGAQPARAGFRKKKIVHEEDT
jgi:hypothetical protein